MNVLESGRFAEDIYLEVIKAEFELKKNIIKNFIYTL